jgi:tyrosinase
LEESHVLSIAQLQSTVDDILRAPAPAARPVSVAADGESDGPTRPRMFSAFHLPDVWRAKQLAAGWMDIAEQQRSANGSGDGIRGAVERVLAAARDEASRMEAAEDEDPELVRHALKLFVTHYRHGLPIRIATIESRAPHLILPSVPPGGTVSEDSPETRLLWFREDPKLNEHHEHWHVVYPIAGIPAPGNRRGGQVKERQGELFLYMHRQMIARYDTERIGAGLDRVVPWDYYDIDPWGYDPGPELRSSFGPRPPNRQWVPTPEPFPVDPKVGVVVTPEAMATRGQRLFEAASSGTFMVDGMQVPVTVDLLGTTQQADIGTVETSVIPWNPPAEGTDEWFSGWYNSLITGYYGNFHNVGHDMFGYLSTNYNGVMGFVPTAMRDHVFYRWHKLIDNLYATWQDTQPSHDFSADVPAVVIRKNLPGEPVHENASPDIILCRRGDLVPWDRWDEFGQYAFGGSENWDRSFASGTFEHPDMPAPFTTTDELRTTMHQRVVTIETGAEPPARQARDASPHRVPGPGGVLLLPASGERERPASGRDCAHVPRGA